MDKKQQAKLVAQAHNLNPVVMIGQKGLTPEVISETDKSLSAHELIKIKISQDGKAERLEIAKNICEQLDADFLKLIGKVAIIYRQNP